MAERNRSSASVAEQTDRKGEDEKRRQDEGRKEGARQEKGRWIVKLLG